MNEHLPTFDQEYSATLLENTIPSDGIVTVSARDDDAGSFGQIVRYELTGLHSNLFNISTNGVIRNLQEFDFETDELVYDIVAAAIDGGGRRSSTLVHIDLIDTNDHTPVFDREEYSANISESATHQQIHLLTVHATDNDGSPSFNKVTYSILEQPCSSIFTIDSQIGRINVTDITVLSDSISATSPLGPVSPLMGSFSLGSTDMDIGSSDSSLETGKYIVIASAVFHVADLNRVHD